MLLSQTMQPLAVPNEVMKPLATHSIAGGPARRRIRASGLASPLRTGYKFGASPRKRALKLQRRHATDPRTHRRSSYAFLR
jgi:hypothetical protein